MDGFPAEQGVHRRAVEPGKLLHFIHADAPLPLFHGDESRSRDLYCSRRVGLRDPGALARDTQTLSHFGRSDLIQGHRHRPRRPSRPQTSSVPGIA